MGLLANNYALTGTVNELSPMVMNALECAAERLSDGSADEAVLRWFGDDSNAFKQALARDLRRMRSVINVNTITIGEEDLVSRDPHTNAAAFASNGRVGLGDPVISQGGNGPHQHDGRNVFFNSNFKHLPKFLPKNVNNRVRIDNHHQSQLNTLIHELSHLLIGTDDEVGQGGFTAYGTQFAERLARYNPVKAKNNAENWGIFVEACGHNRSA